MNITLTIIQKSMFATAIYKKILLLSRVFMSSDISTMIRVDLMTQFDLIQFDLIQFDLVD